MIDFLRFAQPAIIATLSAIVFILVAAWVTVIVMKKFGADKTTIGYVPWVSGIIIALLVVAFVWQMIIAVSVNNVPRGGLDRSVVETQSSRYLVTPTSNK